MTSRSTDQSARTRTGGIDRGNNHHLCGVRHRPTGLMHAWAFHRRTAPTSSASGSWTPQRIRHGRRSRDGS